MRIPLFLILTGSLLALPSAAQKRAAATKEPTFPEAVEQAKKSFDAQEYGAAVTALQAAIRAVQKLQRTAILTALPKPEGFTIRDEEPPKDDPASNPFAMTMGMVVLRHYDKGDGKSINLEVMANSPMAPMLAMMFANPSIVKADGGEIVEHGKHKALLKKNGDTGQELTILLFDKHVVKATAESMTAEELLAVFDQAAVDRVEKALGN